MRRAMTVTAATAIVLTVMGAPAGAGGGGYCVPGEYSKSVSGPTAVVEMKDACFTPTVLYVEEGTEVTFVNRDPYTHNLAGPAGTFVENMYRDFRQGDEQAFLLQRSGSFPYMCALHPGMAGVIVVGDGLSGDAFDATEVEDGSAGVIGVNGASAEGGSSTPALAVGLGIAVILLIAAVASLATRKSQAVAGAS